MSVHVVDRALIVCNHPSRAGRSVRRRGRQRSRAILGWRCAMRTDALSLPPANGFVVAVWPDAPTPRLLVPPTSGPSWG